MSVREAAERLVALIKEDDNTREWIDTIDVHDVAEAYLAEHQADDDEPIDLKGDEDSSPFQIYHTEDNTRFVVHFYATNFDIEFPIEYELTKGQLRKLVELLGGAK